MKKSHTLSLAGLVLPVLAGLSACSGTTPAPAETAKHDNARGVRLSVGAGANIRKFPEVLMVCDNSGVRHPRGA